MNRDFIHSNAHRLTVDLQNQGFTDEAIHHYTDAQGNDIFWKLRLENKSTDTKEIRPMSYKDGRFIGHLHAVESNHKTGK